MDSRLRVGHATGKTEEEIAPDLMEQVKMHAPDENRQLCQVMEKVHIEKLC